MDGNNSLKLVDSTFRSGSVRTDNRVTSSKRWISPDDVDVFKDEVNKKVLVRYQFPSDYYLTYTYSLKVDRLLPPSLLPALLLASSLKPLTLLSTRSLKLM
jgi:hypothetical protein